MRTILQLVELDRGGFDLKRGEGARLLFRRSDEGIAKDEAVGADAHDVVLRERYRTIDDLFVSNRQG
jgi:hypothetical protein